MARDDRQEVVRPAFVQRPGRAQSPVRKRGISLNSLDREMVYAIGYTGRRWEIIWGLEKSAGRRVADQEEESHAQAAGAHGTPPGRHAAPDIALSPQGDSHS